MSYQKAPEETHPYCYKSIALLIIGKEYTRYLIQTPVSLLINYLGLRMDSFYHKTFPMKDCQFVSRRITESTVARSS